MYDATIIEYEHWCKLLILQENLWWMGFPWGDFVTFGPKVSGGDYWILNNFCHKKLA